jgi:hypothetical protein
VPEIVAFSFIVQLDPLIGAMFKSSSRFHCLQFNAKGKKDSQ